MKHSHQHILQLLNRQHSFISGVLPCMVSSISLSKHIALKIISLFLICMSFVFNTSLANEDEYYMPEIALQNIASDLKNIKYNYQVAPLGQDLMGEQFDKNTGTLRFEHIDVSLPGNSNLPVEIRRNITINSIGTDWGISTHMLSVYKEDKPGATSICSEQDIKLVGTIYIPGQSKKQLIENKEQLANAYSSEYPFITKDKFRVRCISQSGGIEQGFEAQSPEGIIYTFDLIKSIETSSASGTTRTFYTFLGTKVSDRFNNWVKYDYEFTEDTENKRHLLKKIYSSDDREITLDHDDHDDVEFVYVPSANGILTWEYRYIDRSYSRRGLQKVILPDGRFWELNLSVYIPEPAYDFLFDWEGRGHGYDEPNYEHETITLTLTHPDGTHGVFEIRDTDHCDTSVDSNPLDSTNSSVIITKSYPFTNPNCPYFYSLVSKTLSGPGMESQTWQYEYSENIGNFWYGTYIGDIHFNNFDNNGDLRLSFDGLDNFQGTWTFADIPLEEFTLKGNLPSNIDGPEDYSGYRYRSVKITEPDDSYTIYYLNRDRRSYLYGKTVAEQTYSLSGELLKEKQYEYQLRHAENYTPSRNYRNHSNVYYKTVITKSQTQLFAKVDSSLYTNEYMEFNDYDVAEIKYQYNDFSEDKRYIKKTFSHDTTNWLLNMPTSVSVAETNEASDYTEVGKITYHASTGSYKSLPNCSYSFGIVYKCNTQYYTSGNTAGLLKKTEYNAFINDSNGNATTIKRYQNFADYHRGQPQTITVPNRYSDSGTMSMTRTIDDFGQMIQGVDFEGNTTNYGYDDAGRIQYIDPLDSKWADTVFTWSDYNPDEANQPTRTVSRCTLNADKSGCEGNAILTATTTYDSRLRGLLIATTDVANDITVYQNNRFNANNQPVFQSFPSSDSAELSGTSYTYDALQRKHTQSVSGGGTVTTEYLADNKIQLTDAEDNITTTTYRAYGVPSYNETTVIESPVDASQSVTTTIALDIFGNTTAITQAGAHKNTSISQTEYRAYNSDNRLCKTTRADVGQTIYAYNAAGELDWQAQGVTVGSTDNTSCTYTDANIASKKVNFYYDNVGAQRKVEYADNSPDVSYVLDNNGDLLTLTSGTGADTVIQNYNYTNRLLDDESLHVDGYLFTLDYDYNTLGHLSHLTYPIQSNIGQVSFSPNAFGQATQAIAGGVTYASDVLYYTNGMLDSFTYGNGIKHKTTLNGRQLPKEIKDFFTASNIIKLGYEYDDNQNITKITDSVTPSYSLTDLSYDGLDRLITTTGNSGIGSSAIEYDALGNITKYQSKGKNLDYKYNNYTNQLWYVTDTIANKRARDFISPAGPGWDERGNILNNNTNKFTYNLANQMTTSDDSVGSGRNLISYLYDGNSRRVKTTKAGSKVSYSMYSQSGKLMYSENNSGTMSYIFLGGKLIAKDGTMTTSADSRLHYKPFGESIESPKDDVGYTGHKFDTDIGLSYMQARYYDPVIGRFYSNDPIGFRDIHSFNRYGYANNNPYKYVDPTGMFSCGTIQDDAQQDECWNDKRERNRSQANENTETHYMWEDFIPSPDQVSTPARMANIQKISNHGPSRTGGLPKDMRKGVLPANLTYEEAASQALDFKIFTVGATGVGVLNYASERGLISNLRLVTAGKVASDIMLFSSSAFLVQTTLIKGQLWIANQCNVSNSK